MFNFTSLADLRQSDAFNFRQPEAAPEDGPQTTDGPSETMMTTRSAVTGSSSVVTTEDDVEVDLDLDVEGNASGTVGGSGTNEAGTESEEMSAESPVAEEATVVRTVSGSTTTEVDMAFGGDTDVTITETDTDTVDGVSTETVDVETFTIEADAPDAAPAVATPGAAAGVIDADMTAASAPADFEALFASFGRSAPSTTAPDGDEMMEETMSFSSETTMTTRSSVTGSSDVTTTEDDVEFDFNLEVEGNASGTVGGSGTNEAGTEMAEVSAASPVVEEVPAMSMVLSETSAGVEMTSDDEAEVTTTETDTAETVMTSASAPADLEALFTSFGRSAPSTTAPDGADDSGSFFNTSSGSTVSSATSSVDVASDMDGVNIVIEMAVMGNASGVSGGAGSNADTMVERMESLGLGDFATDLGFAWSDVFG